MLHEGQRIHILDEDRPAVVYQIWKEGSSASIDFTARYADDNSTDTHGNPLPGMRGFKFSTEERIWRKEDESS